MQQQFSHADDRLDVNCADSLGRGALTLSIESENLEMLELLVVMGVETKDALLHAINQEFVEAVELLLEHEELLRNNEIEAAGGKREFHTFIPFLLFISCFYFDEFYQPIIFLQIR